MIQKTDRKILAFYSPYPGAGKTTAAEYRANRTNDPVWSFACPLDDIIVSILADMGVLSKYKWNTLRSEMKETPLPELGGASVRDMLLKFGAAGRSLYPDIWVDCMLNEMRTSYFPVMFIDDLRFPNEYNMLRSYGAKIVRITNPGRDIVPSESETLLEGYQFDAQVVNNKNNLLSIYHGQLDAMMAALFGGKPT